MALYAIGDLHLSLSADKPMDVFGGSWDNYVQKIKEGFSALDSGDTCVLCGDLTWGMTLEESLKDFQFIDSLPGKKIILKGNHDYWWTTVNKAKAFFERHGLETLDILNNNSYLVNSVAVNSVAVNSVAVNSVAVNSVAVNSVAVCGTRGWFCEEEPDRGRDAPVSHDRKIMAREVGRLETSLSSAPESAEKICFLHYPPIFKNYVCHEIIDVMTRHGVRSCWYGHIHGIGHKYAVTGRVGSIEYRMVSADYVGFSPVRVC